ncbi:MAG TPA: DUF2147 domain-containing protein [Segetibacter sp.]
MKNLAILFASLFVTLQAFAIASDDIIGVWANSSNKAHIQIFKQSGKYYGKIVWLKTPNDAATGKPKVDKKNPVESARNKRILGLVVLRDFVYDDEEWKHGKIYNPEDGKEYKSYINLKGKELLVRGYVGFSLLGKTEKFSRVR